MKKHPVPGLDTGAMYESEETPIMKNLTRVSIAEFALALSNAARLGDADREGGIPMRASLEMMAHLQLIGSGRQEALLHSAYCAGWAHQGTLDAARGG